MNWYKISQTDEDMAIYNKSPCIKVDSSFIDEICYYKIPQILEVKLLTGRTYIFADISQETYENFISAPSKGKFFNMVIKKKDQLKIS